MTSQYLFPGLRACSRRLGLQQQHRAQERVGLVVGEGDVGVVMETEDLRRVVDG